MALPSPDAVIDELNDLRSSVSKAGEVHVDAAIAALQSPASPGLAGPEPQPSLSVKGLAARIDHTQLRPEATDADIEAVSHEAIEHAFASVCVAPTYVPLVNELLEDSGVAVCTVIGFPHGANRPSTKAHEAMQAIRDGAVELDMVLNIGALRSGAVADVEQDIAEVVNVARRARDGGRDVIVKVILETALLSDAEKAVACIAAKQAGADFVKTSTGFADGGATLRDVALMRQVVGPDMGVKASGGVRSADDVEAMMAHGATRIGASGSVAIVTGAKTEASY
ncbi:deoxyribose-phosphate aldolase [Longibacter salinarum]|uniref:Deoxyribose-phosphate aldolase n=1 Tax=Longibacter salinarum TaxID=1850348 RepID=A0A2A8CZL7_9BACT|nr:deoxyribose-phosphate aldolase [Longibacter salinarum]PEN14043.1 deoxyribose-phosphate aldolase [Longibacter salinarum]